MIPGFPVIIRKKKANFVDPGRSVLSCCLAFGICGLPRCQNEKGFMLPYYCQRHCPIGFLQTVCSELCRSIFICLGLNAFLLAGHLPTYRLLIKPCLLSPSLTSFKNISNRDFVSSVSTLPSPFLNLWFVDGLF